jgi:DNA-binding response OmpR family regulator
MVESNHHSFYDLVILDVRMAGINGLQLYQRFKNINDKTKIVFLTALDAVEEIATIFPELTRENILQKPISNTEFIRRIKRVIKG